MNNTQNYGEQGGASQVFGGTVDFTGTVKKHGKDVSQDMVFKASGRITLAQLNAGYDVAPDVAGKQYKVVGYYFRAIGGNAGAATDARLSDKAASPVDVVTMAVAALTANAEIHSGATISDVTKGAGWMTALTAGKGLQLRKTGSTMTTMTHLDFIVEYQLN